MIERIFSTNFNCMLQTTMTGRDLNSRKDYVAIIPYLNNFMYILRNDKCRDLTITLADGRVIKSRSKFLFSQSEIMKIESFANELVNHAQISFGSSYIDVKDDKLVELIFPRIEAKDDPALKAYFLHHQEFYTSPDDNQQYLFRIPINFKLSQVDPFKEKHDTYVNGLRLPNSYTHTIVKDDAIYTNNVLVVKRSIDRLEEFISNQMPNALKHYKKECKDLLALLQSTINDVENVESLKQFSKDLGKAWQNYQQF